MSFLINPAYFRSRQDSRAERVCQWETPKELKGGLQKNLRICPLKATLLAQNTMPESGWVELTTSVPVRDDEEEEQEEKGERGGGDDDDDDDDSDDASAAGEDGSR